MCPSPLVLPTSVAVCSPLVQPCFFPFHHLFRLPFSISSANSFHSSSTSSCPAFVHLKCYSFVTCSICGLPCLLFCRPPNFHATTCSICVRPPILSLSPELCLSPFGFLLYANFNPFLPVPTAPVNHPCLLFVSFSSCHICFRTLFFPDHLLALSCLPLAIDPLCFVLDQFSCVRTCALAILEVFCRPLAVPLSIVFFAKMFTCCARDQETTQHEGEPRYACSPVDKSTKIQGEDGLRVGDVQKSLTTICTTTSS